MDPTSDPVGFRRGPQPLEVNGLPDSRSDVSYSQDSSSTTTTANNASQDQEGGGRGIDSSPTHVTTPDDLFHFLDSLTPRSPISTTATGPSSTSLSVQSTPSTTFENQALPLFPQPETSSSSLGFLFDPLVVSDDTNNDKLKQQDSHVKLTSTFAMNGKGFDAGDISMPFDLSLPLFDTIAYPVFHQSVQPFEKSSASSSTVPLGSGVDPVALDSTLDSPLDFSGDASPWSDLLASPMFSLPNSGTVSETPLPPLDPSSEEPSSLFPPLPTPASLPYETSSTTLRPLPPLPVRPSIAPLQSFPSPTSSASMALPTPPPPRSTSSDIKVQRQSRPEPTGFRTTIPLLDLDAPIQTRNPVIASSTSRKRKTAGAEKALAKKRARQEISPTPVETSSIESGGGEPIDPEELPADIAAQVERKRLQNTMSARKSRARKQAKMQELEEENRLLAEENARLKAQLEALLGAGMPQ